jgi:hypothetical protein
MKGRTNWVPSSHGDEKEGLQDWKGGQGVLQGHDRI